MNSSLRGNRRSPGCSPVWFAILLLGNPLLARASDETKAVAPKTTVVPAKPSAPDSKPVTPAIEPSAMVTGSRIPQKLSRLGKVPTLSSPVSIITREQLSRSGSSTLTGALARSPFR